MVPGGRGLGGYLLSFYMVRHHRSNGVDHVDGHAATCGRGPLTEPAGAWTTVPPRGTGPSMDWGWLRRPSARDIGLQRHIHDATRHFRDISAELATCRCRYRTGRSLETPAARAARVCATRRR